MWVLYNSAHMSASIKSADGEAWVRVLGFFSDKAQALAHAQEVARADRGLEIRIAPAGDFRMMMRFAHAAIGSAAYTENKAREEAKHAFLMARHVEVRAAAFQEALDNAEKRQMGSLKFSAPERAEAHAAEFGQPLKAPALAPTPSAVEDAPEAAPPSKTPVPPAVRKIGPALEVRMQRFAALAVIPDYEHAAYLESQLSAWESARDAAYATHRNAALSRALGDRVIPSFRESVGAWVDANPPPAGYNAWGQKQSSGVWEKNGEAVSTDSEVVAWLVTMRAAQEFELWAWLGAEKPDRAAVLRDWIEAHPLPRASAQAEPAVAFLACAETEAELRARIEQCAMRDVDIACVVMYEWIKINRVWENNVTRTFRDPMLTKLHSNKDFQQAEAAKLRGHVREIEIDASS